MRSQGGEEEGGVNWEGSTDTYILSSVKQAASGRLLSSTGSSGQCPVMTEGWDRRGRSEAHERGGSCIHRADSLCCTAEMNRILQSNYTPIFFKKRKLV